MGYKCDVRVRKTWALVIAIVAIAGCQNTYAQAAGARMTGKPEIRFTPVLAKHSKNFSLQDSLAIGVDRMQRNFEPMRRQTEHWRQQQLSGASAKLIIYRAFIEGDLQAPKHLAGLVHDLYFNPKYEEFQPRTMWSLSNAFTSAFKELEPIPQFKATAKLGVFLEATAAVAA